MSHRILSILVALLVGLSMASDAWARASKSTSTGSRGTRTYDRPIERSYTPPPATAAPARPSVEQTPLTQPAAPAAQQPMYRPGTMGQTAPGMAAAAQPSFFQRNPMMAGVLGGLVGAGIGSMLFGHSPALAAASDAAPGASMMGILLQVALIGGLAWLAFRLFRRKTAPAADANPYGVQGHGYSEHGHDQGYQRDAVTYPNGQTHHQEPQLALGNANPRRIEKEFEPSHEDKDEFTRIVQGVQKAWSDGNMAALRPLVTPEILGWMSEDLARDQSKGLRNVVENVTLLKGDVTESWREEKLEYATAMITFSALDYMVEEESGKVVEGDAHKPVEATEAWTFARSPGGKWLLSAIEQV